MMLCSSLCISYENPSDERKKTIRNKSWQIMFPFKLKSQHLKKIDAESQDTLLTVFYIDSGKSLL